MEEDADCMGLPGPDVPHSYISRVPERNGVSLLYIMLEIHHSGREPLISSRHVELTINLYDGRIPNKQGGGGGGGGGIFAELS